MALLTTHIDIFTLLLSLLLSLDLSSHVIGNASVFASDSLLTFAVGKQLLVDKSSLLFGGKASEIGRRNCRGTVVVGERLHVLVRRLDGLARVFGGRVAVGLVGRGGGGRGTHGLFALSIVAHLRVGVSVGCVCAR